MFLFSKKPKKTKEELQEERNETISKTSNALKMQIVALNKKRESAFGKVLEARQKGLKEQELQARNLLKQIMVAIKREEGMLLTLEIAVESRDLAQLNMNFLDSIGTLSEDIISSSKNTGEGKTKAVGDKYLRAIFEANKQKERIDNMLSVGEFSSVVSESTNSYSELDQEIDSMLDSTGSMNQSFNSYKQKN